MAHAIESLVSTNASDYTDPYAVRAIELVFKYLPKAVENGDDMKARKKMHNASTMAGMAFSNSSLGIVHSLAHKIGGELHVTHGLANAILLFYVIEITSQALTTDKTCEIIGISSTFMVVKYILCYLLKFFRII